MTPTRTTRSSTSNRRPRRPLRRANACSTASVSCTASTFVGRLPAHPSEFNVEDIARIVGVWPDLELVVADDDGVRYHFVGEVLFISAARPPLVRLLSTLEFAAEQELNAWWRMEGWD